jgi:adenosylmethionine-8-amino-7-oxononanoate aminotransferase
MAYQYWCHLGRPERKRFIGFTHGYHGDTFGAMAVSRDPLFFGRFEPLLLQADILPLDPNRFDDHLRKHAAETAGVIIEPLVQGAGGMRMHSPATLRQIFEVTRTHDVLFLADEVMTGGGRTGTLWAHQQAGISPDLVCAGKTLTGGVLPLAATMASRRIVDAFDSDDRARTFFHGHSFTAHSLACAVAASNWSLLLQNDDVPALALEMQAYWQQVLTELAELPQVREVRICGSIAAVEMAEQASGYLAEIGQRMRRSCLEDGVLLRPLGSVLYAMPPLRTRRESLEKISKAMIRAVTASRAP